MQSAVCGLQMSYTARFVDVSESEIDQFKENAVPQKTIEATKFGVKLFEGRLIKFLFCK